MRARRERIELEVNASKKAFSENRNIIISHTGKGLLKKCSVVILVKGLHKQKDSPVELAERHRLNIYFPPLYPIIPPIFKFTTPTWHPSIKNSFLALSPSITKYKSLTDIIVYISQIIQYREFPKFKINKEAAKWADENSDLWPKGRKNITARIDTEYSEPELVAKQSLKAKIDNLLIKAKNTKPVQAYIKSGFSFKTILHKYIAWAILAFIISFGLIQLSSPITNESALAWREGYDILSDYLEYSDDATNSFSKIANSFNSYCQKNDIDPENINSFIEWYIYDASKQESLIVEEYLMFDSFANDALSDSFSIEFENNYLTLGKTIRSFVIRTTAIKFVIIITSLSLLLCLSEGLHYGSKIKASIFALIGTVISLITSYLTTKIALGVNSLFIKDIPSNTSTSVWYLIIFLLAGAVVGVTIGITKRSLKRFLFCFAGGTIGGVLSALAHSTVYSLTYNSIARLIITTLTTTLLIALFIGIGEQFAKTATLKVINSKSYRKEYMIFSRKTRIGHKLTNTVLFKKEDRVAPRHFFIINEKNQFVLIDYKTPHGTFVNGEQVSNAFLKSTDKISLGNINLEFLKK